MPPSRTALIVGAGIGGLAAGIALRRAGWQVRIFERAARPRELGFGVGLAPNAMAALRELGVADAVDAHGFVPLVAMVRRPDGSVLRRLDVSQLMADPRRRTVVVLRPVLHGALLAAFGEGALTLDSPAENFTIDGASVVLELSDGRTASGDVLIGADGVSSVIRSRLHPAESPPRSSGYTCLRGVAYGVEQHLGDLGGVVYLGDAIEVGSARAGDGAVYWYASFLADDVPADAGVATALERCLSVIRDEWLQILARETKPDDLRFEDLLERDPLPVWGAGPVSLLGDAAHPMLPHSGQGAALALEDAVALGLALARVDDPRAALRCYERVRIPRTRSIVMRGHRVARTTTTRSTVVRRLRDIGIHYAPRALLIAAFWLQGRGDPHRALR